MFLFVFFLFSSSLFAGEKSIPLLIITGPDEESKMTPSYLPDFTSAEELENLEQSFSKTHL